MQFPVESDHDREGLPPVSLTAMVCRPVPTLRRVDRPLPDPSIVAVTVPVPAPVTVTVPVAAQVMVSRAVRVFGLGAAGFGARGARV